MNLAGDKNCWIKITYIDEHTEMVRAPDFVQLLKSITNCLPKAMMVEAYIQEYNQCVKDGSVATIVKS